MNTKILKKIKFVRLLKKINFNEPKNFIYPFLLRNMEDKTIEIQIKKIIFEKIYSRIKDPVLGFDSVSEYVNYVLEEVLNDLENESVIDEQKKVEDELRKLGYI